MRRAACFHASRARKLCYSYVTRTAKRSGYKDTLREFCASHSRQSAARVRFGQSWNNVRDEQPRRGGTIPRIRLDRRRLQRLWFINKKWWSSRRRLEGDEYRSCMLNELR